MRSDHLDKEIALEMCRHLEKSVSNLGDALDSIIRLTTTKNKSNDGDDSYNFQTDFV